MLEIQNIVGGRLNKVQESLQAKKKKLEVYTEINKLKKEMRQLLDKKGLVLCKIGLQAHYLFRTGRLQDSLIEEFAERVEMADKKIFLLQRKVTELAAIEDSRVCSKCKNKVELDDKFCGSCGAPIEEDFPEEPSGKCNRCGEAVSESFNFCAVCGYPFSRDN